MLFRLLFYVLVSNFITVCTFSVRFHILIKSGYLSVNSYSFSFRCCFFELEWDPLRAANIIMRISENNEINIFE